ncbi:MAG: DUF397 domain-containing protein [Umezawaea sp.]
MTQLNWKTSTRTNAQSTCVELAQDPDGETYVRDTKNRTGPVLDFRPVAFSAFLATVRRGDLDMH